jgi:hypothetical protein
VLSDVLEHAEQERSALAEAEASVTRCVEAPALELEWRLCR